MNDATSRANSRFAPEPTVPVWDLLVRVGHWVLVATFAIAYLTGDDLLTTHVWAGYAVGVYVLVRVVWGFVGSKHARFADFLFSPVKGLKYLVDLLRRRSPRYLGHSPAGAMMVFALLLSLTGTVVTGTAELALSRGEGPLALVLAQRDGTAADAQAQTADESRHEESAMQEIHELLANLTLILIAFHVAGVILASVVHKESLLLAMFTGRKRANSSGPRR